jgi:hypothetical protein
VQRYHGRRGEDILVLLHDLIHLLLLCGEIVHIILGCGYDLFLTMRVNREEDRFPNLRDDLPAFLGRDQGNNTRRECLGYLVKFHVQSNNNTTRPRLIYKMMFP